MRTYLRIFAILHIVFFSIPYGVACDNTPLLVVYDPVEIAGGQWNLEVFVCFGSEESEDGFTLQSSDGSLNIINTTPSALENPLNGNIANSLFSGGVLNYYYDNSDGSNYNDATGETGPCVDFEITVDSDPTGSSFTMAGVNDGCLYTISDDHLTAEVTETPTCSYSQSITAPGSVSGSTEFGATNCNFRDTIFSSVKEEIIEVIIPCDGNYTFSLCGSSYDTWMAISYQCCFLPFASNDNYCGSQSELNLDLLAGSYYVLVEGFLWDDYGDYILNVTSSTDAVNIQSIDVSDAQCSLSDAEITIHASGDDGPFNFSIDGGSTFFSDSLFSGLSGGNYFIQVEGQSGCIASTLLSINTNPPLVIDSISTSSSNCSSGNGELIINVSTGTIPYQYSIDNGLNYQSANTFSNLNGGDYLIRVIDFNGCEINTSFTLDSSSTPIIQQLNIVDASCGLATGKIEIIASGDAELSYSIDGLTFQSSPVFTGLIAGNYPSITVQTANTCSADTSLVLFDQGSPVFDQINLISSDCDSTGSIELIVSGGGGNYMYSIDGGLNYSAGNMFSGLASGNYNVTVIDDNLCIVDSIINLDQNTSLSLDAIILTNPTCDSSTGTIANNGEIDISASGGTSTLSYSIDAGATFQSSAIFSSLNYGAFTIVVSDGSCTQDSLVSLSTNPGPSIEILDARDLACGEQNGFIAVKVINAVNPNYIYEFDNGVDNIQSTPTTDDQYSYDLLGEGIWNVIVTDGDGCKADTAIELMVIPDISINDIIIDSVYCGQNDGALSIIASSGNLPIEFSFANDFSESQGNGYFGGLSAGSYTVYLRDARLCLDTVNIDLLNNDGVIIDSVSSTNPSCLDHDGEITIYASEGAPPYIYSVDNGLNFQTSNYFSGLHDESYEILVIDSTGCIATSEVTLVQSDSLTLSTEIIPIHCDEANGEITILASGGDNNFIYSIDNGAIQSNNTGVFSGLSGGYYSIDVVDGQGCVVYDNAIIDSIPIPQIDSVEVIDATCGEANASINISVSSGISPYQYSIDNGINFNDFSLFENLAAGNYPIVIRDSLMCTDSSNVDILPGIQINIAALLLDNPSCGNSSGSVIIIVENAISPVQYILNTTDTNATGFFENLIAATYTIEVIDAISCTADTVFTLSDSIAPNPPAITMADFSSCENNLIINANDPLGNDGMWTVIEGNASIVSPSDSTTAALNLDIGINQFVWTISNGVCPNTSDTLTINLVDGIIVDAGEDQYNSANVPVMLNATSNIPGDFLWTPPNVLSDPNIPNPVAELTESTQFIVTVSNDYGCFGEDSVWVYIDQMIEFPTAFTPDGDGNNDTWIINNIELYPDANVSIMSRYGNTVFESKGYPEPWDGTYKGKDVPVGSYFYIIDLGDDFETKTGSVSVIR